MLINDFRNLYYPSNMVWNHFADYLKGSLNSLGRALNIHNTGNAVARIQEDPAAFEKWKAELAAAISIRQMDNSALVSLGRRGFNTEFRFWVMQAHFILFCINNCRF